MQIPPHGYQQKKINLLLYLRESKKTPTGTTYKIPKIGQFFSPGKKFSGNTRKKHSAKLTYNHHHQHFTIINNLNNL